MFMAAEFSINNNFFFFFFFKYPAVGIGLNVVLQPTVLSFISFPGSLQFQVQRLRPIKHVKLSDSFIKNFAGKNVLVFVVPHLYSLLFILFLAFAKELHNRVSSYYFILHPCSWASVCISLYVVCMQLFGRVGVERWQLVCVFIYRFIFIYIRTYIHIYIHISSSPQRESEAG